MILTKSETFAVLAAPTAGVGMTIADVNGYLTAVSIILGIAYLVWKWKREANTPPASK